MAIDMLVHHTIKAQPYLSKLMPNILMKYLQTRSIQRSFLKLLK